MRNDKPMATKLRKAGKSYKTIGRELNIPKSTLSEWFSGENWSKEIKKDLAQKANYISRKKLSRYNQKRRIEKIKLINKARISAKQEYSSLSKDSLFIAGLMLYWGEGDSKLENNLVRLSNTNPNLIRVFTLFLTIICNIPTNKIKGWILLYPDLNETKCLDFWSNASGLELSQFTKPTFIKGRHPTRRLSYGVCQITHTNRLLKEKIAMWIDLFQAQERLQLAKKPNIN